jgi:hypothetical protein
MRFTHAFSALAISITAAIFACGSQVTAQTASAIPQAITTPDKVETRLGTLEFRDGAPRACKRSTTIWSSRTHSMHSRTRFRE